MQTVVNFPTCTKHDCPDNAPFTNHDHRFEDNHVIWHNVGRMVAAESQVAGLRRYPQILSLAEDLLDGVDYAIIVWVVHYATVTLGWNVPAMERVS